MITIYYPRECPVKIGAVIAAELKVHVPSVPNLTIAQYKELLIDIQDAIDLIESFPADYNEYCERKEEIKKSVDDFNSIMFEKWR
jgi:hypothetical protein